MKHQKIAFDLPISGKALDFIKIMAALYMIIDHINTVILMPFDLFDDNLMYIGRGSFPLFCFATACAMHRCKSSKAGEYAIQLLILALITHPIAYHAHNYAAGNVLFTLAAGAAFCRFYPHFNRFFQTLICLWAIYSAFIPVPIEFGFAGVMMPALMLLFIQGDKISGFWLFIMIYFSNASGSMDVAFAYPEAFMIKTFYIFIFATLIPFFTLKVAQALPKDGRYLHRYALQVFYPGHLLLFAIIAGVGKILFL